MNLQTLNVHSINMHSLKRFPINVVECNISYNPIFSFCENSDEFHEVSGISKFLTLKDEKKNPLSYAGSLRKENLYKFYKFL